MNLERMALRGWPSHGRGHGQPQLPFRTGLPGLLPPGLLLAARPCQHLWPLQPGGLVIETASFTLFMQNFENTNWVWPMLLNFSKGHRGWVGGQGNPRQGADRSAGSLRQARSRTQSPAPGGARASGGAAPLAPAPGLAFCLWAPAWPWSSAPRQPFPARPK